MTARDNKKREISTKNVKILRKTYQEIDENAWAQKRTKLVEFVGLCDGDCPIRSRGWFTIPRKDMSDKLMGRDWWHHYFFYSSQIEGIQARVVAWIQFVMIFCVIRNHDWANGFTIHEVFSIETFLLINRNKLIEKTIN